jgi:hypothetical protein
MPAIRSDPASVNLSKEAIAELTSMSAARSGWWNEVDQSIASNPAPNTFNKVLNVVTDYAADNTGTNDASTAIQNALNATPTTGGIVYLPAGTYKIGTGLTVAHSSDQIITAGMSTILLAQNPNTALLTVLNKTNVVIGDMFYDGAWQTNTKGLVLDGAIYTRVGRIGADRMTGGALVLTGSGSATQICARNYIQSVHMANGNRVVVFNGRVAATVSNNMIEYCFGSGASNAVSTMIDFQNYADTNSIFYADVPVNFAGSTAVSYNSGVPGSANGVYENHIFNLIADATVAGCNSVVVNNTERAHYIRFRPGGAFAAAAPVINAGGKLAYMPGSRTVGDVEQVVLGSNNAALVGFYGVAPTARAGAIATPNTQTGSYVQADVASLKTSIDAIRVALFNLGLTQ